MRVWEGLRVCRCPVVHPPKLVLDKHHLWPLGWGGPDTADNLADACPNAHRLGHTLLNRMKKNGGPLPYNEARSYGMFVKALAERGWKMMVDAGMTPARMQSWPDLTEQQMGPQIT